MAHVCEDKAIVDQDKLAEVLRCCREGDLKGLEFFHNQCTTSATYYTSPGPKGYTPLHEAVEADQHEIVHWLLINGVNADIVCKTNKQTPLHIACWKGHVYCVKSLLRANADISLLDDQGQSCLNRAEKGKKKDIILPLLRSKQLCLLVARDDTTAVKDMMTTRGIDPDTFQPQDIEEAIILAVSRNNLEALEQIIVGGTKYMMLRANKRDASEKEPPKQTFPELETALQLAFQLEFIEAIGILLLCKAVEENDPALVTRLLSEPTANQNWYIPLVREALESGRFMTVRPIYLSVMMNRPKVTKELLLLTELDMKKRHVDWSNLRLHNLHSTWIQAITPWVLFLKVTRNRLQRIPVEMLNATQLLRLDLSENHLKYIPPGLFALPNLQELDLKRNQIADLQNVPEWSPSLRNLNIGSNNLETLPSTIQYSMIDTLNLSKNKFQSLPKVVCHMPNLSSLDLSHLSITDLPPELGNKGRITITNKRSDESRDGSFARWSRRFGQLRTKEKQSKPNNNLSLIIIGGSEGGRQLLTHRLMGSKTLHNNSGPLELLLWNYKKSVFTSNKINFTTLILPNDSLLCHLYPCFFNPCALYVIVVDLGEHYSVMEQISVPMTFLSRYIPQANVQFVMLIPSSTLQDTADYRKLEEVKASPSYKGFVFHDTFIMSEDPSTTNTVVTDPRPKLFDAAMNVKLEGMNIIGAEYPESYFSITEGIIKEILALTAKGQPLVLTEQELWRVIENSCRGDKPVRAELPAIQEFLELVGLVLHFPDPNYQLRNFYFICPCWTFDQLCTIVNHVFQDQRLVWPLQELQGAMETIPHHLFFPLLRILMRFAIALPIAKDCCLFPFLLPNSTPPPLPAQSTALRRQYCPVSQILPCDIWHRIIAMVVTRFAEIVEGILGRELTRPKVPESFDKEGIPQVSLAVTRATNESFELLGDDRDLKVTNSIELQPYHRTTGRTRVKMIPLSQRIGRQPSSFYYAKKKPGGTSLIGIPESLSLFDTAVLCDLNPCCFVIRPCKMSFFEVGIEVATPNTKEGQTLMARLCFMLQNLLQDWYPELYSLDTEGTCELTENVQCPACIMDNQTPLSHIGVTGTIPNMKRSNSISCSKSNHSTPYAHLLPDIHMQDVPDDYHVKMGTFTNVHKTPLHTSVDHCVYHAKWNGSDILLKEFSWNERLSPILPYFQMRQEVTLLLKLKHANIIRMEGLVLDFQGRQNTTSPAIVLERAPLGTLRDNLWDPDMSISRITRFHIARQVADALDYLHCCCVIYRALRSSSVLVWSLNYEDNLSIKLTNFNRARQAYAYGLHNKPNFKFPCVQAPEMYHLDYSEEYTYKVDIYAYGFLLHEMMSVKPVASQSNVVQPPKLKEIFLSMYSSLAELMQQCWKEEPNERPSALDIVKKMKDPVFQLHHSSQALQEKTKVRYCCVVESAHQIWCSCDVESPQQIWSPVSDATKAQIFIISADNGMSILGSHELTQLANCIATMDSQVLVGLNRGTFRVYESQRYQCTAECSVTDSVTTIAVNDMYAFVGQANGTLTYYPKLSFPNNGNIIQFGVDPIFSMVVFQNVLLVACGMEMIQVNAEDEVREEKRWSGCSTRENGIYSIAASEAKNCAWSITRTGFILRTWDLETTKCTCEQDLSTVVIPICEEEGFVKADRVLSILSYRDVVWLSFNNGLVTIMDARMDPMSLIMWFRPHVKDTKCQLLIPSLGPDQKQKRRIVTTGYGDHVSDDAQTDKPVVSFWEALEASELSLLVTRSQN